MRSILFIFPIILVFSCPALCQVDTLQLVEIGSIQAPSEITELYVEDLDGDSLKEIIICTDYYVYIYNSQTLQVEWTSPPLNGPMDLLFEDINRDGYIDFSVKDSTNIHLFDPHTPQTIWSSPALDSTYKCYTIGDRNDDDWTDVAIVSKEPFTRPYIEDNMDTVWIDFYIGPLFYFQEAIIIELSNYFMCWGSDCCIQTTYPVKISFRDLTGLNGLSKTVILSTQTSISCSGHPNLWYSGTESGEIWLIPSQNPNNIKSFSIGETRQNLLFSINTDTLLFVFTKYDHWTGDVDYLHKYKYIKLNVISADTLQTVDTLWEDEYWGYAGSTDTMRYYKGEVVGEINYTNIGIELCYGYEDSLELRSFPDLAYIWILPNISNIDSVISIFYDPNIYNSEQVVIGTVDAFIFVNGETGNISGFLYPDDYIISCICDLDNDQSDELFVTNGNNVSINRLEFVTGITGDMLPYHTFLHHNYPNPFNSSTTIEYGLPEPGWVRIDIYDLLGRKVETLADEDMQAGRHRVLWDASGYSSGVYFYRIESGDFVDTKRMVYLK